MVLPATSSPLTPRFALGTVDLTPVHDADVATVRSEDVACIVHDLKSPLATIALALSVLESRMPDAISRRALEALRSSASYMDRLVVDVLDCTHEGSMVLDLEMRRLPPVISAVVARLDSHSARARVVLEMGECAPVRIDVDRIERVITNLVSNALAYSPASSRIVVRLEQRRASACISVIDRGPGLTPDDARRVFDRYSRGRASKGNGLGLYASRKLVEMHGGTIGVETVEGAGARFFVEIPISAHEIDG